MVNKQQILNLQHTVGFLQWALIRGLKIFKNRPKFLPFLTFRTIRLRKFRGQQPAGPAGNTSSVGVMLDELEWPSLEARRDQSSLFHFHKIHCGAVFIEKDKLTV